MKRLSNSLENFLALSIDISLRLKIMTWNMQEMLYSF